METCRIARRGTRLLRRRAARDPRGGRQRGRRRGGRVARVVRRRDRDDGAARRRVRDLLGRRVRGTAKNLDCFCAVPSGKAPSCSSCRCRSARSSSTTRSAPRRSPCRACRAGLGALHARFGRLPWRRRLRTALRLARVGVPMTPAQASCLAMLAPVMTMDAGARIYAPGRHAASGRRPASPARDRERRWRCWLPRARSRRTRRRSRSRSSR